MADLTVRYFSDCLKRSTTFRMYLPNTHGDSEYAKRKTKVLFLLHGYCGDAENWVPEHLSDKYNFAVVIPNGENSFWLDGISTGHKFCTFLGEELPGFIRKTFNLAVAKEDTYIMGLSMGGFGALHTALAYPDVFSTAICLSSAFIHNEIMKMEPGTENAVANYEYYRECFGEPAKLSESDNNPEVLIRKLKGSGHEIPAIYMACGTEDFLLNENRAMDAFLKDMGVEHVYEEATGTHNMEFWTKYVEIFVPRVFGK